jgi:transposase
MNCRASIGSGNRWTGRRPSHRSAGKKTGKNPTDRGKTGVKRSLLTDADGIPIGVAVEGANRHDIELTGARFNSIAIDRPQPRPYHRQHLHLDKGYDYHEVRELAEVFGYTAHIRSRGDEKKDLARDARKKARRWVVERSHSWLDRFRRILIRWEKKPDNYLALFHLAFALIPFGKKFSSN